MALKLHLLTAVTRPENLEQMYASFALTEDAGITIIWHRQFDLEKQYVGGQHIKNGMLDVITDGWVYILDDDNVLHPDFGREVMGALASHPDARLIAIAQQHRPSSTNKQGWVRQVSRDMLRASHVDAGQVIIRRDAIGEHRIPEHYCGDGDWIEQIANRLYDEQLAFVTTPAAYYNWLR